MSRAGVPVTLQPATRAPPTGIPLPSVPRSMSCGSLTPRGTTTSRRYPSPPRDESESLTPRSRGCMNVSPRRDGRLLSPMQLTGGARFQPSPPLTPRSDIPSLTPRLRAGSLPRPPAMRRSGEECPVRVVARFRPLNEMEKNRGNLIVLDFLGENGVRIGRLHDPMPPEEIALDNILQDGTTQEDLFAREAQHTVDDVMAGYNGTILAYGQTGSGKTYTIVGKMLEQLESGNVTARGRGRETVHDGIIPNAARRIFESIESDTSGTEYIIKCSYLEVYMEQVRDLLNPVAENLLIHESPNKGVFVGGLTEEFVSSSDDVVDLLRIGCRSLTLGCTKMNERSSRSHSVFTIFVQQRLFDGSTRVGKLNLVDLAGSERVKKSGSTGTQLEEAKKINQSLSTLSNVIRALTEPGREHIPYRDSKLTRILQDSLGGNFKTTLIVTCSPHFFNLEETISSLKFGLRAKFVQNNVHVNQTRSADELEKLVSLLTAELEEVKRHAAQLEKRIEGGETTQEKHEDTLELAEKVVALEKQRAEDYLLVEELKDKMKQMQERESSKMTASAQQRTAFEALKVEAERLKGKLNTDREAFVFQHDLDLEEIEDMKKRVRELEDENENLREQVFKAEEECDSTKASLERALQHTDQMQAELGLKAEGMARMEDLLKIAEEKANLAKSDFAASLKSRFYLEKVEYLQQKLTTNEQELGSERIQRAELERRLADQIEKLRKGAGERTTEIRQVREKLADALHSLTSERELREKADARSRSQQQRIQQLEEDLGTLRRANDTLSEEVAMLRVTKANMEEVAKTNAVLDSTPKHFGRVVVPMSGSRATGRGSVLEEFRKAR